jgi:predicted transcriptional regulator
MPDELMQKLNEAAEKMRRSKGWIINDAVTEYLAREERDSQMLEETREALADIKAGRVVDGAKVVEWLNSWGTPDEKSPPEL